jgi:hypothetical protein
MATRIKALASFANSSELGDIGGLIATGQTAVVADEYAEELERQGLVEIIDTDVDGSEDGAEAESDGTTSTSSAEADTSGGGSSQEDITVVSPSEESPSEEGGSAERSFEHTDYVDEDGTLTEEIPNYDVLAESGITTFDELAEVADDFEAVNRIGPTRAETLTRAWDEIVSGKWNDSQ